MPRPQSRIKPQVTLGVILVLYLAHIDFGIGRIATPVLGVPISLWYHILYCFAVSATMVWLVRVSWPVNDDENGPL